MMRLVTPQLGINKTKNKKSSMPTPEVHRGVVVLRTECCRQDGGAFLPILNCCAFKQQFGVYDSDLKQFTQREVSSNNPLNAKYSGTQGSA